MLLLLRLPLIAKPTPILLESPFSQNSRHQTIFEIFGSVFNSHQALLDEKKS